MSFVTVRGATATTLSFDTTNNTLLARQLAAALQAHAMKPPAVQSPLFEITVAEAIQAGIVQFVHFDWETFDVEEEG